MELSLELQNLLLILLLLRGLDGLEYLCPVLLIPTLSRSCVPPFGLRAQTGYTLVLNNSIPRADQAGTDSKVQCGLRLANLICLHIV